MPQLAEQQIAGKRTSCQLIEPRLDKLPKLKTKPNTAISPESLAVMLKGDRDLLIRWGIDNELTPDELKKLVFTHKDMWSRLHLQQPFVESLLEEYNKAYKSK